MKNAIPCTLRLESEMYERIKRIARSRHVTITAYLRGILAEVLRQDEQKALYDAFSLAGEEADTEFAVPAQRRVIDDHG